MRRGALVLVFLLAARAAQAAVVPDPGGAGAWGAGGALLADPAGPLAVFDAPSSLSPPHAHWALAAQRARLFELDALARVRAAAACARGPWAAGAGFESFGPAGARFARLVLGLSCARGGRSLGIAWSERRGPAGAGRAGALDVAARARAGTRLELQLAARGLLAGGSDAVQADPDWTAEVALDLGPARAHLARTRDLHGARAGGGIALAAGPLSVRAGALGPPASWTLGVLLSAPGARGAPRAGFARVVHPVLGASDVVEGGVSW